MSVAARSNVIACVWDFDETLIRGYMQTPLFRERFAANPKGSEYLARLFWDDVHATERYWRERGKAEAQTLRAEGKVAHAPSILPENVYLERFFAWMHHDLEDGTPAPFRGMTRTDLARAGASLEFYEGVLRFLGSLKELPDNDERLQGFVIEHYVVSTGFADTIRGSAINEVVDGIFATEFAEGTFRPGACGAPEALVGSELTWPQFPMNHALKTQALFTINKGHKAVADKKYTRLLYGVDDRIPNEFRHVPWEHMIYSADGPSDIPAFALLKERGGLTVAIADPLNHKKLVDALALKSADRVDHILHGDFRPGSMTWDLYHEEIAQIAARSLAAREAEEEASIKSAVHHRSDHVVAPPDWFTGTRRPPASQPKTDHGAGRANVPMSEPAEPATAPRAQADENPARGL